MTKMEIGVEAESVEGKPLNPGDLVWAKMKGFPYWPGRVALESEMPAKQKKKGSLGVFFFGSNN